MQKFKQTLLSLMVVVTVGLFLSTIVRAADETKEPVMEDAGKAMDPEHAKMMEIWKEYSTPTENHRVLDQFVGKWDHTVKWWMKPNTEPEVSTGQSDIQWILGGRHLEHKAQGTSMGQPFEGLGIYGYDNAKKEYFSIWLDNMGTGMMEGHGKYDAATNTFSEEGSHSCPIEATKEKWYRTVTKFVDADHYTYEMFMKDETGNEFRGMLIVYSRVKS